MKNSLLNFQPFGKGKIEFGQEKSMKRQGSLFLTEGGHPELLIRLVETNLMCAGDMLLNVKLHPDKFLLR